MQSLIQKSAVAAGITFPDGILRFESIAPIFNQLDFSYILSKHFWSFITIVLVLLFNDLFDTLGTLIAVAAKGNMLDKNGKIPNVGKIF